MNIFLKVQEIQIASKNKEHIQVKKKFLDLLILV